MITLVNVPHEISINERGCNVLGSIGCQPVLFGSLPKSLWNVRGVSVLHRVWSRGQAADNNRLAACAPQTKTRPNMSVMFSAAKEIQGGATSRSPRRWTRVRRSL